MTEDDPLHLSNLALPAEMITERRALLPRKIQKRQQHFVRMPWAWVERLRNTKSANTYRVALHLLYLYWKTGGASFSLANGGLAMEGVTRHAKWRALRELERLGLIMVERRPRKSPLISISNPLEPVA
jgi:hypothetical protein